MTKSGLVLAVTLLVMAGCAAIRPAPYSGTDSPPPGSPYTYRACTNGGQRLAGAPWWCRALGRMYADRDPSETALRPDQVFPYGFPHWK